MVSLGLTTLGRKLSFMLQGRVIIFATKVGEFWNFIASRKKVQSIYPFWVRLEVA